MLKQNHLSAAVAQTKEKVKKHAKGSEKKRTDDVQKGNKGFEREVGEQIITEGSPGLRNTE